MDNWRLASALVVVVHLAEMFRPSPLIGSVTQRARAAGSLLLRLELSDNFLLCCSCRCAFAFCTGGSAATKLVACTCRWPGFDPDAIELCYV